VKLRSYLAIYVHPYRFSDFDAVLLPCRDNKKLVLDTIKEGPDERSRSKAARAFCPVQGLGPPLPDGKDRETMWEALLKRMGQKMPDIDKGLLRQFRSFVRVWCAKHLRPLDHDTDFSVESWLADTHYTEKQKERFLFLYASMMAGVSKRPDGVTDKFLLDLYGQTVNTPRGWELGMSLMVSHWNPKWYKCKSFCKAEFYMEPKHARWINSRSDNFKVLSGPVFKKIEHALFTSVKSFIKTVPLPDRAKYIDDMLKTTGGTYFATDFTSFEAGFHPDFVRCCELQLYKYMVKDCPQVKGAMDIICQALTMKQSVKAKACRARVEGRMSGDMCTSLGNGFSNYMIAAFWAYLNDFEVCGVFEGDDGLVRVPSDALVPPQSFYEMLGFKIKIEPTSKLNEAGFCKQFYAEGQPENLRDPLETVLKAGWTKSARRHGGEEVIRELARSMGFAILCETPACPISAKMGLYLLRATEGSLTSRPEGWWEHQRFKNVNLTACVERAMAGPSPEQRQFVWTKWGISPPEQQHIESYFDSLSELQELTDPVLVNLCQQRFPYWITVRRNLSCIEPAKSAW